MALKAASASQMLQRRLWGRPALAVHGQWFRFQGPRFLLGFVARLRTDVLLRRAVEVLWDIIPRGPGLCVAMHGKL